MKIIQHYEKCLSQASYYIEHNGIAALIDPLRDTDHYKRLARRDGAKIKYIFETHFHADFVSGHLELAHEGNIKIIFGPRARTSFNSHIAYDGETFNLDGITIKVLHTPGHTLESSCYLLINEQGEDVALFTGDTLFMGDVGRPDLAQDMNNDISTRDLAGMLYDSLRIKILPLSDKVIIYPGHGAGSACGKNMSRELSGTLGEQRILNYALNENLSRKDFIDQLCEGLPSPPPYFPMNVGLNSKGYPSLKDALIKGEYPLTVPIFSNMMKMEGIIVLDTRNPQHFSVAHIPGSVNIGLDGSFAPWVGAIIPAEQPNILIVCEPGREKETIIRIGRIGYDNCVGYLGGGIDAWLDNGRDFASIENISPEDLWRKDKQSDYKIIDVRTESEVATGRVKGSIHIPLSSEMNLEHLDKTSESYLVYCAGGYRSMIFISLLKKFGFQNLFNIEGGYGAIRSTTDADNLLENFSQPYN